MKKYIIVAIYFMLISIGMLNIAIMNGFDPYRYVDGPVVHTVQLPLPAPVKVVHPKAVQINYKALDCMTKNIYFEARGQGIKGMRMVAYVVMQRVKSPQFPNTVCGVVHQAITDSNGNIIRNRCQFSWYCDGRTDSLNFQRSYVANEWDKAQTVAMNVLTGHVKPSIDMRGVTYYHANYVDPYWAHSKNFKLVAIVGDHMFYRWKKAEWPKRNIN